MSDAVALVVPAKGRRELTGRLLDSLRDAGSEFRVILVDDASTPPLAEVASKYPELRLTVIANAETLGPAASRNVGLWSAKTEFVAFTDNDVTVTPGWMVALHEHMKRAPDDVAGVGGRVVDDGGSLVGRYATRMGLLDPYVFMGRTVYLVTANCMFRRCALLGVGGFDESYVVPGGEDPDASFRLLKAGYRLEREPSAVVVHHYGSSWLGFYRQFRRYGRGCRRAMAALPDTSGPGVSSATERAPGELLGALPSRG